MKSSTFLKIATAVAISISAPVIAQNVDRESVEFDYIQLPSKPLGKNLKGYTVTVSQTAVQKNSATKAEYDARMKELDARDKAQAEAANKTKVGSVLNALQKKTDAEVNAKLLERVPPFYLKEYSADVLANQYVNLNGYKKGANDIEIAISLEGFQYNTTTYSTTTANPVKHYYSFTYKNPANMKVSVAGTVATEMLVPGSGNESTYTSGSFNTKEEAEKNWIANRLQILEKVQDQSLSNNLSKINPVLNDYHGFTKTKRQADLYTVKNKKGDYNDVVAAYTELNEGLLSLGEDLLVEEGKTKIAAASEKFETILKEANITDKKARINQDVSTAILFNLVEANIWLNEFMKSQKFMLKLKSNNINGREERRLEELKEFIVDHKQRFDANK